MPPFSYIKTFSFSWLGVFFVFFSFLVGRVLFPTKIDYRKSGYQPNLQGWRPSLCGKYTGRNALSKLGSVIGYLEDQLLFREPPVRCYVSGREDNCQYFTPDHDYNLWKSTPQPHSTLTI